MFFLVELILFGMIGELKLIVDKGMDRSYLGSLTIDYMLELLFFLSNQIWVAARPFQVVWLGFQELDPEGWAKLE